MKLTEREKAYHKGYEQGRFDEYAERMGYDQAEKVKAKIDKQKNCPYCHGKKELRCEDNDYQRLIINDTDSVMEYEECVVKGTYVTEHGEEANFTWKAVPFEINYCPICGRRLNHAN